MSSISQKFLLIGFVALILFGATDDKALYTLLLKQGVEVFWQNGGELKSNEALLKLKQGHFTCYGTKEKLSFSGKAPSKKANFFVQGRKIIGKILPQGPSLERLVFLGEVEGNFDTAWHFTAGKAKYLPQKEHKILLYPDSVTLCSLQNNQGSVNATFASLLPTQRTLFLKNAKGEFLSSKQPLSFSAKKVLWKEANQEIVLQDNVNVSDQELGNLKTQKAKIWQKEGKVIAIGESVLHFAKRETIFKCNGAVVVDNNQKTITATGDCTPLSFEDKNFLLFADHLVLKYALDGKNVKPNEIVFEGEVHLISHSISSVNSYATCDKLIYLPESQKMVLSSNKKVLFWQEDDSLSLSAQEIEIEGKNVKGVGNVHFTLNQEEETIIKQIFSPFIKKI